MDAGDGQKREGEHGHGGDGHEDGQGGAVEDSFEAGEHLSVSRVVLRCSIFVGGTTVPMPMINTSASFLDQINIE